MFSEFRNRLVAFQKIESPPQKNTTHSIWVDIYIALSLSLFPSRSTMDTENMPPSNVTKAKGGKTIEQTYQKKTQLEHILLRPDTYSEWPSLIQCHVFSPPFSLYISKLFISYSISFSVGSIEKVSQSMWVYDTNTKRIVKRDIAYVSPNLPLSSFMLSFS